MKSPISISKCKNLIQGRLAGIRSYDLEGRLSCKNYLIGFELINHKLYDGLLKNFRYLMSFKVKDYYFKKAKKENYFARSIYKLEEVNTKYKVLNKGDKILDLGYHPGSWTQYAAKIGSVVVGIDIKPINQKLQALKNVNLYEADAFNIHHLNDLGVDDKFDVVLSDMAPNTTGIKDVDQQRSLDLVEKVFNTLPVLLKEDGNFVIKIFDSHEAQMFIKDNQKRFKEIKKLKPKSTRSVSKEFFLIGKGFIG